VAHGILLRKSMERFRVVPSFKMSILFLVLCAPMVFIPPIWMVMFIIGIGLLIRDNAANKRYNKELKDYLAEKKAHGFLFTQFIGGVETIPPNAECIVCISEESLDIQCGKTTITVTYESLAGYGIFAHKEITDHFVSRNKGVVSRGITGGLLFGPVGAIIGGMTGVGKGVKHIEHSRNTNYLAISTETKTLVFTVLAINANLKTYSRGVTDWVVGRIPQREIVLSD